MKMFPPCRMLVFWWLAVGAMPGAAQAQSDFNRYFNAAVQLYNSGESERALEQLQNAKKRTSELQHDISVALYEGLILADLGQREQALAAFETALLLDPEAKLPTKVSPKLSDDFEEVRKRVLKKGPQASEPQSPLSKAGKNPTHPPPAPTDRPSKEPPRSETPPAVTTAGQPGRPPANSNLNPPATPAPKPYAPQPQIAEQSRPRVPVAPLVLAGVGIASAGAGIVFGMQSRSNTSAVRDAYKGGALPSRSEVLELGARLEEARRQARMANVSFGTAVLAAGGAVATWLLTSDDSGPESKGER